MEKDWLEEKEAHKNAGASAEGKESNYEKKGYGNIRQNNFNNQRNNEFNRNNISAGDKRNKFGDGNFDKREKNIINLF